MKTLLGWILDPYLHVLLIGLLLVWVAMGWGADEKVVVAASGTYCERCNECHEGWSGGCRQLRRPRDMSVVRVDRRRAHRRVRPRADDGAVLLPHMSQPFRVDPEAVGD